MAGAACRGSATFRQHPFKLVIESPLHQGITAFNLELIPVIVSVDVNDYWQVNM